MITPPLLRKGIKDTGPDNWIGDPMRGLEFDYFFTGKRLGAHSNIIELHITSTLTAWNEKQYIRNAYYSGDKNQWKEVIKQHIYQHLLDKGTGAMFTRALLRDFEVVPGKFKTWENYNVDYFTN